MKEVEEQPSRAEVRARFPRDHRLLRHADFDRVYRQGRRHFAAHMTIFFLPRQSAGEARVGFTVGRALGGAVERNRIRRRLREAVRMNLNNLHASVDVVINPKKTAIEVDFAQLGNEIAEAFQKIQSSGSPKTRTSRAIQS
ncbi:MAG: ribonuclease P protein component [Acidobacteriaceae bacterium]|nr:ribonuclease P protein component [Acidobacteriaceae bacterium]